MNTVRARVWRFKVEKGPDGAEAVLATEIGQGPLPVSLSELVHINALACDLRKVVDQRVRDHEISLLTSYIAGVSARTPLMADCPALDSSSGHIRRFVSECTGLGVMTAASEALFDWQAGTSGLSSFDVLPEHLVGIYSRTGVRPDLLFDLAGGPVAGEARGRRRDAKEMFPAAKGTAAQKARLVNLAKWSVAHGDHPYSGPARELAWSAACSISSASSLYRQGPSAPSSSKSLWTKADQAGDGPRASRPTMCFMNTDFSACGPVPVRKALFSAHARSTPSS
ncbi:hypothetical protein [Kitasatospora sp. MAP5-34]|uniref:hypothetical protein n=1 Tax=Kitasatospora sp. MAP5-34 TaxID=3035102 RepID=UPI002476EFD0|nr:hypothetical protein [Kitasatospora sp. MAP5-34]MDH6578234.1 hypothetical protein [Kitasatospora sp. MAP5-34]